MLRHSRSKSSEPNPDVRELARTPGEGNLAWGERAATEMKAEEEVDPKTWSFVALLGGADTLAFRLRIAQAHLRPDMFPSFWSDAIFVRLEDAGMTGAEAVHVPLLQPERRGFAPAENGVVSRPLADFDDAGRFPNIALIALPVQQDRMLGRLDEFRKARPTLDALEHALRWLAFAWGVARTANPLHENYGIPSACMLETMCAAEGFDLTPGLESRASCPEAIWASARHWHEYFKKTAAGGRRPAGRFTREHSYPILESQAAATAAAAAAAAVPAAAAAPAAPSSAERPNKRKR